MSEEQFEEIRQLFADLQTTLQPALGDNWRVEAGGKSLRVYKADWCDGQIHFESWVTNADLERKSLPVAFHFEASKEKTGIKRNEFNERLIAAGEAQMNGWKDYRLSPKSYQTFIRQVSFSPNLLADMKAEYLRLAALAPAIDQAMAQSRGK